MAKRFEVGKNYKVRFYDHSIGSKEKIICETEGWVVEQDTEHLLLTYWRVVTGCEDVKRDNIEPVSIIKACIISARKLP